MNYRNENDGKAVGSALPSVTPKSFNNRDNNTTASTLSIGDICNLFADSIRKETGVLIDPIADGNIHRINVDGKRQNKPFYYVLHAEGYGAYGDFRTGLKRRWVAKKNTISSPHEMAQFRQAKADREQQLLKDQLNAALLANELWSSAKPANAKHNYLVKKNIPAMNLRQSENTLLVPIFNNAFELVNLQRIFQNGEKRFFKGCKISGCFALFGEIKNASTIGICEGVATGITLHIQTQLPIVCALSANNMEATGKELRKIYPEMQLIVYGDNDRHSKTNIGKLNAQVAAFSIGASLSIPEFPCAHCNCTDFNDLANCKGDAI